MLKRRIFLYFSMLVLLALMISGLIATNIISNSMKDHISNQLHTVAALSQGFFTPDFNDYNLMASDIRSQYNLYEISNHDLRVTIITSDGAVLGETHAYFEEMHNHLYRPEVQSALAGYPTVTIRKSATTNASFMYLAVPVTGNPDLILRLSVSLDEINALVGRLYLAISIGFMASLVICIIFAYRLSSYVAKPVTALTMHALKVSDGNFSERLHATRGSNEILRLSDTLNIMTGKLETSFNDLKLKNIQIDTMLDSINEGLVAINEEDNIMMVNKVFSECLDIDKIKTGESVYHIKNTKIVEMLLRSKQDDIKLSEEILTGGKTFFCYTIGFETNGRQCALAVLTDLTQIRKLENIRFEFVSNVTHELNTPLTSIQGYVETLKHLKEKDKDMTGKFLDIIDIETQRLKNLIHDILTLSRMESMLPLDGKEEIDLHNTVDEVICLMNANALKQEIQIYNNTDSGITILADPDHMRQLFINLLDNAIKYNKEQGSVILTSAISEGILSISIKDTGIGIEQKDLERLFERFYRVDTSRSSLIPGTGLGLSIVKHIVMLYNGTVSVASIPGEGSEFIIKFPVHSVI
ncbi:MAG: ATP-binding protein [Clostridia bacterium]